MTHSSLVVSKPTHISMSNRRENEARLWLCLQFIRTEHREEEPAGTKAVYPLDNSQPYQRQASPARTQLRSHPALANGIHPDSGRVHASVRPGVHHRPVRLAKRDIAHGLSALHRAKCPRLTSSDPDAA